MATSALLFRQETLMNYFNINKDANEKSTRIEFVAVVNY